MAYDPFPLANIGGINAQELDPLLNDAYKNMSREVWRDYILRSAKGANLGDFLKSASAGSGNVVERRYALADAMAQLEDLMGVARGANAGGGAGPNLFQRQASHLGQISSGVLPSMQGNFAQELLNALADDPNTPEIDYKNTALRDALGSQAGQQAVFDAIASKAALGSSGFGRMGVNSMLQDIQEKSFGSDDRFEWLRRLANQGGLFDVPKEMPSTPTSQYTLGDPNRSKPVVEDMGGGFSTPFGGGAKKYPSEDEQALWKVWAGSY